MITIIRNSGGSNNAGWGLKSSYEGRKTHSKKILIKR